MITFASFFNHRTGNQSMFDGIFKLSISLKWCNAALKTGFWHQWSGQRAIHCWSHATCKQKNIFIFGLFFKKKISYYIIGVYWNPWKGKVEYWLGFLFPWVKKSEWIIHHQSTFRVKNKWMMYYNTHYIAVAPSCKENEVKDDWKMFEIPTLLVYAYTMAVCIY